MFYILLILVLFFVPLWLFIGRMRDLPERRERYYRDRQLWNNIGGVEPKLEDYGLTKKNVDPFAGGGSGGRQ